VSDPSVLEILTMRAAALARQRQQRVRHCDDAEEVRLEDVVRNLHGEFTSLQLQS
jgi:hypothetical protein